MAAAVGANGTARAPPREAQVDMVPSSATKKADSPVASSGSHCRPDAHSWSEPLMPGSARRGRLRRWAARRSSRAGRSTGCAGRHGRRPASRACVQNLRRLVRAGPARRDPAEATIPFRAVCLVAPAPEGAPRNAQRRFALAPLFELPRSVSLFRPPPPPGSVLNPDGGAGHISRRPDALRGDETARQQAIRPQAVKKRLDPEASAHRREIPQNPRLSRRRRKG